MEQAISRLGRSLPLKREVRDGREVVSFKYAPERPINRSSAGAGAMVYVKYYSDVDGLLVKVAIVPQVLVMLLFVFSLIFISTFPSRDITFSLLFFLGCLFFLTALWWETVEIKRAIQSLFQDSLLK